MMLQLPNICSRSNKAAVPLLTFTVVAALCSRVPAAATEVPDFEPDKWNKAYVFHYANIGENQKSSLVASYCDEQGDIQPSEAEIGSCYWSEQSNGTYSYWEKVEGSLRENTNCYCYALNAFKDGFCIPSKVMDTDSVTCDTIRDSMVADGAKIVSRQEALGGQPSTGHYVAMLSRNDGCTPDYCWEYDFHAVRKDSNGLWSWKEPTGSVNNKDIFGKLIQDPENQKIPGEYETFCGFYQVWPEKMLIRGYFGEDSMEETFSYKKRRTEGMYPTVVVWFEPSSPYNKSADGALNQESKFEEEKDWESKRGTTEWKDYYAENPQYKFTQGNDPSISGEVATTENGKPADSEHSSVSSVSAGAAGRKMLRDGQTESAGQAGQANMPKTASATQPKLLSSMKRDR